MDIQNFGFVFSALAQNKPMSRPITQIELTSKPLKLALALTGIAFLVALGGFAYSLGEPDMSTTHWFVALLVTFAVHQVCRAARWWEHG